MSGMVGSQRPLLARIVRGAGQMLHYTLVGQGTSPSCCANKGMGKPEFAGEGAALITRIHHLRAAWKSLGHPRHIRNFHGSMTCAMPRKGPWKWKGPALAGGHIAQQETARKHAEQDEADTGREEAGLLANRGISDDIDILDKPPVDHRMVRRSEMLSAGLSEEQMEDIEQEIEEMGLAGERQQPRDTDS